MADDKRCGTCASRKPLIVQAMLGLTRYGCTDQDSPWCGREVRKTDGTTCPCWQRKEDGDGE